MPKKYDRNYFDSWYRSAGRGLSPSTLKRKVALAVAATETVLENDHRHVHCDHHVPLFLQYVQVSDANSIGLFRHRFHLRR